MKKIALMRSGYVKEDLTEIDPQFITYCDNYDMVYGYLKSYHYLVNNEVLDINDYHTFEVEKVNGKYKEIEGTEKQIPKIDSQLKLSCTINFLQCYTGNKDLDSDFHKGFTIGKGKQLYFMFIWHSTGNVTVYPIEGNKSGRWIKGDTKITIHFKN